MRSIIRTLAVAISTVTLMFVAMPSASAHQHRPVGPFETTVGWLEEPAYAGFRNAVQFIVERRTGGGGAHGEGEHAHGEGQTEPVENAELKVVVIFGEQDGTERTEPMDLAPAFGAPGEYRAFLIPTRPGTYTFHITGTIGNRAFDEYYTSGEAGANERSEGTYNDMRQPAEVQFPEKDPSAADLGEQVLVAAEDADSAGGKASTATILSIIALVLGAGALLLSLSGRKARAGG